MGTAASDVRVFPCTNCGASLRFDPGVGTLTCANCGTRNERPAADAAAMAEATEELDYLAHLHRQAGNEPEIAPQLLTCPQCGAQTRLPEGVVADSCAFCAMPLVSATAHAGRQIRPRALVPFAIDRNAAVERFRGWIGSRWFAPNALKQTVRHTEGIRGVYLPCWTFDARTTSDYVGERGIDRQVQETRRDAQGNTVVHTRTVTDWYPASGTVYLAFDDTLVPASRSLPAEYADVLSGWDTSALAPYDDHYVAGFTVEAYQLALEPAFAEAKQAFDNGILRAIHQDIGGNHQRVHHVNTRYDDVTFKHILLPAWICSYRFRDRSWRVVVNGQTGAVRGDRPWSPWKIGFAVLLAALVGLAIWWLNGGAN
jgi:predicted RNA-binding Zn-ribbon protein involved in translation (DUF1610 family)